MCEERRALIIGDHPIKKSIVKQLTSLKYGIKQSTCFCEEEIQEQWNDIFVLSITTDSNIGSDAEGISVIEAIYTCLVENATCRPTIHLLLNNQESCDLLNHRDYNDEWHTRFELNAFTIDDIWAKNVLCPNAPGSEMCGLDYLPITYDSNHTIHLVLFGTNHLTSALMENAALIAHYPNYIRSHSLRTRITVIDDNVNEWSKIFISRHKALMDNSFYRYVNIECRKSELHKPMYDGKREDFVDVEWEFVEGNVHDVIIQDKLLGWASDNNQLLSVAICHNNDETNLAQMSFMTNLLHGYDTPIYIKQSNAAFSSIISQSPLMSNVQLIGMNDSGYDVTLPLLKMAKRVKYVYDYCYRNNIESDNGGCITAPSFIDDCEAEKHWLSEKKAIKRFSNLCNAMTLKTKMRSLGHVIDNKNTFYAITKEETDIIARVEHNRWNVEEMLLGFRPCNDEEQAEIDTDITKKAEYKERLIHYDLRAYNDLRADNTGKNVNTYDLCLSASIPLIAYENKI